MTEQLRAGILLGLGSVDTKLLVLRRFGEKFEVLAYTTRLSSRAELELCAAIAYILREDFSRVLEKPHIAISILSDIVESTKEMNTPVSLREYIVTEQREGA